MTERLSSRLQICERWFESSYRLYGTCSLMAERMVVDHVCASSSLVLYPTEAPTSVSHAVC
jgi:hypothetical protein